MELNKVFYHQKMQLVTVNYEGVIKMTENTLFHLNVAQNIKDFHPVFETIIPQILEEDKQELAIPCLFIEDNEENKYCDLRLKRENGYITVLFFNFTSRYKAEQHNTSLHNTLSLKGSNNVNFSQ